MLNTRICYMANLICISMKISLEIIKHVFHAAPSQLVMYSTLSGKFSFTNYEYTKQR